MRTNATAQRRHGCSPPLRVLLRLVPMPSVLPLLLLLAATVMLLGDTASADPSIGDVFRQIRERAVATEEIVAPAPPNKTRNERILEQWSKFELNLQDLVDSVIRKVLPTVIRRSSELEVSPDCRDALLKVVFGIRQLKRWAFQFLDAAGKPAGGILTGTLTAFGSYDQCVAIEARDSPQEEPRFTGRYCTVELRPPIPNRPRYYTLHDQVQLFNNTTRTKVTGEIAEKMHFFYFLVYRYGVCVPSTCSREDVETIAASLVKSAEFEVKVSNCEVKDENGKLNPDQTAIVTLVCILTVIALASTGVDLVKKAMRQPDKKETEAETLLARFTTSFSMVRSLRSVFRPDTSLGPLSALHGLRSLTLLWFMLGHIFLFVNYQFFRNLMIAVGFAKDFSFQIVINSTLATDTLIFLNGFLFGYHGLVDHESTGRRRQPIFSVLHKAFRAVVAMLLATMVAILLPVIGSGPMWKETMESVAQNCHDNWWLNVLFVNNIFVAPHERCLEITWYFAVLIQLCLVGTAVIFVLQRRFFVGVVLNASLVAVGIISMGVLTATYKLPPTVLFAQADINSRLTMEDIMYQKPWAHLGPFCIGIGLACIVTRKPVVTLNPILRALGWVCSFLCAVAVVFGAYRWNCGDGVDTAQAALYAAVHRTVWAFAVAWVAFACVTGKAWLVGDFLSWPAFGPLSRMAPLVFLLHPLVQNIFTAYVRERVQADQLMALFLFCGLFVLGYLGAVLCSVLADAPLHSLEQLFCERLGLSAAGREGCPRRFLEVAKPVLKALPLPSCTKITILGEKAHAGSDSGGGGTDANRLPPDSRL
ncbi:nose resistant to fluoxetine protein 6-like [Amblyomma americanum]